MASTIPETTVEGGRARGASIVKVLCAFAILVLFKYSGSYGCSPVVGALLVVAFCVFRQLFSLRLSISMIFCDAWFRRSSILHALFKSRFLIFLFSVVVSLLLALSVLSFVYNAPWFHGGVLFANVFFFAWIYGKKPGIGKNHFTENAAAVFQEIVVTFINVLFLYTAFLLVHFVFINYFSTQHASGIFSPEIPAIVAAEVHHDCLLFQHYVRTTRLLDLTVDQLHGMEGIGWYIYYIVFFIQYSFFPFLGITLLYKSFINVRWLNKKVRWLKRKEPNGARNRGNEHDDRLHALDTCDADAGRMRQGARCDGVEGTPRYPQ